MRAPREVDILPVKPVEVETVEAEVEVDEDIEILDEETDTDDEESDPSYSLEEEEFQAIKGLLSDLEDAILMLPFLGIRQDFADIMDDKMAIYESLIQAYRALYTHMHKHIFGPNNEEIETRRSDKILKE